MFHVGLLDLPSSSYSYKDFRFMINYCSGFTLRFGGKQIHASEDDGSVNHALIRDWDEEAERLEKFGAELEAD